MDAISEPSVERVVVQAGAQLGKSELLVNGLGFFVHQDPSPILLVQPNEGAMLAFSKERIEPTFRATPVLRGLLSDSLRDRDNTIMLKMFPGGMLACAWATSAVSLASRPIRVVFLDEVDRFPDSLGRDGDPIAQAIQRTSNFHNRKIVAVSTPTVEGLSPIARMYDESDQRRLWVPCPRCGEYQVLEWGQIVYKNEAGAVDLDGVHCRCSHCRGRIGERDRPAMLAACEWRADNPGHPHRGYQLSGVYSPWVRWRDLAEQWVRLTADRDRRGLQEFVNLRLGEPWTEGSDDVNAESLEKNREGYDAQVPTGALILTSGVDVQDGRLEVEVVGWGLGKESWGIHYHIIVGDTSTQAPWQQLDEFFARLWRRADGTGILIQCICIDSGGHRTTEVYRYCRDRMARNIFAIKGRAGPGLPIIGKPTMANRLRIALYPVGVDAAKEALMARLALPDAGAGFCHFPRDPAAGYDSEYFRGLCSERRVVRIRGGRRRFEWKQIRPRNEPLDVRNYATAALELLDPDLAALAAAGGKMTPPQRPRRRILSSGIKW